MLESFYVSQSGPASLIRPSDVNMFSREERGNGEKTMRGGLPYRVPRRAQSTHDYVYPTPPPGYAWGGDSRAIRMNQNSASSSNPNSAGSSSAGLQAASSSSSSTTAEIVSQRPPTIHEETAAAHTSHNPHEAPPLTAAPRTPTKPTTPVALAAAAAVAAAPTGVTIPTRPKLPPPRRSYSVQDYEPVPPTQLPSANLALEDLPAELHYAIFDFLDPIDSTCLGLTNKHFYDIHRRMHGTVSLSARRAGPNDMEWVWHLAGRMMRGESDAAALAATTNALAMLRVRGQALCRKCGVSRCELHKHIQGWMGPEYEYCTVREKFGPAAPEGAKEFCYLSNPKDPHRCGRHRVHHKSRPSTPEHKH